MDVNLNNSSRQKAGLGGSENLRAELELLGFKKEVVARFLTSLEKVCVLFPAP
jgi:hypothetical protein